jgi:hypothetical protein
MKRIDPCIVTTLTKCPRCGGRHELLIRPCDPDPRLGKLRGGETHQGVCPKTGWLVFTRTEWETVGKGFVLVTKEVM